MTETWKSIPGYEDLYQVSNLGRVRSLGRVKQSGVVKHEKVLRSRLAGARGRAYLTVALYSQDGKRKDHRVHRLVAEAFVDNPCCKQFVNHIDEDKLNNVASNLEWVTAEENINYGVGGRRRKEKLSTIGKKRAVAILQIHPNGTITKWNSIQECADTLGYSTGNIHMAMTGRREHAYGCQWKRGS